MQILNEPVTIAGIQFGNTLMNGAYINSKTLGDGKLLAESNSGAVVLGSISIKPRKANPGQGYWRHKERFFALNSFGMPNGGLPYFEKALPAAVKLAHDNNKPLIANLIGFSNQEFAELVKFAEQAGADMAELNFGCPNVWDDGSQEHILSYHPKLVRAALKEIAKSKPKIKICVKISPLPPDILNEVAGEIVKSRIVQAITATNSYPNTAITTGAQENNGPSDMLVGMTGRALKPISLGVVKQLGKLLPDSIDIIGCGGISSANDVNDFLAAGAKAVQIATALKDDGLSVFDKILFQNLTK